MNAVARPLATARWVSFALDTQRLALPLESVSRIVRAAEVTPLPLAPDVVAGVIDVAGHILPVYDLRRRLRLPARALGLADQFVIARTSHRDVALIVDQALGLIEAPAVDPDVALAPHVRGVLSLPDGLVLIHDLEGFLSPEEDEALQEALQAMEVRCTPTP